MNASTKTSHPSRKATGADCNNTKTADLLAALVHAERAMRGNLSTSLPDALAHVRAAIARAEGKGEA